MTKKGLLTIIGSCLCMIFSLQTNMLYGASTGNPAKMQEHIEKVKIKNPTAYQDMVDKAGGNVTDCLSCHTDLNKKKKSSDQTNPR